MSNQYRQLASAVILRAIDDLNYPDPTVGRRGPNAQKRALRLAANIRLDAKKFLARGCDGWAEIAGLKARVIAAKYRDS